MKAVGSRFRIRTRGVIYIAWNVRMTSKGIYTMSDDVIVGNKTSERHTRLWKNQVGRVCENPNPDTWCQRYHAERPNDINRCQCHDIWRCCGYQTIWKTYARPMNWVVHYAAINNTDTWCHWHYTEHPNEVKCYHCDVTWRRCEHHNISMTSENGPCSVLHICTDIAWCKCVSYCSSF